MTFRMRKPLRKAVKKLAYRHEVSASRFVEMVVVSYVKGKLQWVDEDGALEDPPELKLAPRAEAAAAELESIISEAELLDTNGDFHIPDETIKQASRDLEDLAQSIEEWEQEQIDLEDEDE